MKKTLWAAMGALALTGAMSAAGESQYLREVEYKEGVPMPEGAGPGEAWCLYQYPAFTETVYDEVVTRPAVTVVKPIPPEFGTETNEYVCKPAYQVGQATAVQFQARNESYEYRPAHKVRRIIPATWKEIQEQVVICEAYTEEYWEPAKFETKNQTFVICPERNELQQVQCVDGTNMDCYVTVRIPAQTETVAVETLVAPGQVKARQVPAKMGAITRCVIDREEQVVEEMVAAVPRAYQVGVPVGGKVRVGEVEEKRFTVTSVKVIREASTQTVTLPEEKRRVPRTIVKSPARIVWRLQRVDVPAPTAQVQVDTGEYESVPGSTPAAKPTFSRRRR